MKIQRVLIAAFAVIISSMAIASATHAQTTGADKLYQRMSQAGQKAFVAERAREIARRISGTEYEFTPAFEADIQKSVNALARRIGNNGGDVLGKGDARFVFERGQTHAPVLIAAFKSHNVSPLIGLYLPLVESEYVNIPTPNRSGATGMFQFLPKTGKRYGLDEEGLLDVEKAADAAARYIADGLKQFKDDPMKEALAVLSYNRGGQQTARDLQLVIDEQSRRCSICALAAARDRLDATFQTESVHYVPDFFAAAIIGENPQAFGLQTRPLSSYEPQQ